MSNEDEYKKAMDILNKHNEYCMKDNLYFEIDYVNDKYILSYFDHEYETTREMEINFCPVCGALLNEKLSVPIFSMPVITVPDDINIDSLRKAINEIQVGEIITYDINKYCKECNQIITPDESYYTIYGIDGKEQYVHHICPSQPSVDTDEI